jgi:hypothetical protein
MVANYARVPDLAPRRRPTRPGTLGPAGRWAAGGRHSRACPSDADTDAHRDAHPNGPATKTTTPTPTPTVTATRPRRPRRRRRSRRRRPRRNRDADPDADPNADGDAADVIRSQSERRRSPPALRRRPRTSPRSTPKCLVFNVAEDTTNPIDGRVRPAQPDQTAPTVTSRATAPPVPSPSSGTSPSS